MLVRSAIVIAACASVLWSASDTEASHAIYSTELYHPAGINDGSTFALMQCGWHVTCDGQAPDQLNALDWNSQNGSLNVYLRLKSTGGSAGSIIVASATITQFSTPCKFIRAELKRASSPQTIGYVSEYHSYTGGGFGYIYGNSAGQRNELQVGSMYSTHPPDPCYWTGPHAHQEFAIADQGFWLSQNPALLTESQCYGCQNPYPPFLHWEWRFYHVH